MISSIIGSGITRSLPSAVDLKMERRTVQGKETGSPDIKKRVKRFFSMTMNVRPGSTLVSLLMPPIKQPKN